MANVDPFEFFKNIKSYHTDINDNFQQPSAIIPTLRSYQRKAVNWMVDREKNNNLLRSDGTPFSGGIIADEMGLGKTVEMLCCIMSNTAPPEFYQKKIIYDECKNVKKKLIKSISPRPSTSNYIPYSKNKQPKVKQSCGKTYKILKSWYNGVLNEMSTVSNNKIAIDDDDDVEDGSIIQCYCNNVQSKNTIVYCINCSKGQHSECVHFEPKPLQEVPFLCADCWTVNDKLQCKATLIVVPQSILNQWIEEIKKHITKPGLSVYIYNGVHIDGYIQPITFNDYDIVITSYNNLSRDLNYVGSNNLDRISRLRYSKKYYYPKSPLPCIKWWRICLDEGQVIECTTCKVSEMTSCLQSVHKWSMTGTPIQKSLNDLYGILKFLDVAPYCNRKQFNQLMNGDSTIMYNWFSNLIWRNLMEDVNSELNIPKLTNETHWLTFSQIEKFFYQTQRNDCATKFSNVITRLFPSLDISVKSINRKNILTVLGPLYKLRQACVHPQAVNGQFLKVKGAMTMENLMDVMIEKCSVECNDILRSLVSQHNAIAGLYLIRNRKQDAVNHYTTVLRLMKKYNEQKLKIDTCQQIHVLYNLTTLFKDNVLVQLPKDCGLDITELRNDMVQLEKDYLGASKQNIEITQKTVTFYSVKVNTLCGKKTLYYSDWWSDILDWIFLPMEFLKKVKLELEDYRVPGVPNIANRLKSMDDVYNILNNWLIDLNTARIDTIAILNILEETPMNDLVDNALMCHLRIKSSKKVIGKKKCLLCKAEIQLQSYESLLFSISNKQKNILNDTTENDEETMYESTSKGLWKMSQKEFLLQKLYQYGQAKIINKNCLNDASDHLKILELVRKEFRYLRLLWTHFSDGLSAHDEIVMAKTRLRLGDDFQQEVEEDPPKKKTKREEENDTVREEYVDYNVIALKTDIPVTKVALENKIGILLYLENLKKEKANSTEIEPCPICCLDSDSGWAVLICGHSMCNQCLTTMYNNSDDSDIVCPLCRNTTEINSVSYVKNIPEGEEPNIKIKGSFSTKIESVVIKLIELISQDPTVKVLIFSTWEKVLNLLGVALEQNSINHRILKSGIKYKKTLTDFKTNEKINVLLMKLSLGSKGLNLTEATRIFFMEPIINKVDELQAVGRIYRIGQKKPTFVHNFIIRDSIEENITKLFASENLLNRWDDITLSQLLKVFE